RRLRAGAAAREHAAQPTFERKRRHPERPAGGAGKAVLRGGDGVEGPELRRRRSPFSNHELAKQRERLRAAKVEEQSRVASEQGAVIRRGLDRPKWFLERTFEYSV